jgi:rSAM/selenodomain-associated transferase 2
MRQVTAIIPTLNAAGCLGRTLASLEGVTAIVADGGSRDDTVAVARANGARVVETVPGRGGQLRTGADAAQTVWMLFLHADTVLEAGWRGPAETFMSRAGAHEEAAVFRFALDDPAPAARRLERMVAWRNRVLALPYGDQGLLIHRSLYDRLGGFRPLTIMEDVDIIRRIGRRRITVLAPHAITSARRWQAEGWLKRSARNLLCLALYYLWVPPHLIKRIYGA